MQVGSLEGCQALTAGMPASKQGLWHLRSPLGPAHRDAAHAADGLLHGHRPQRLLAALLPQRLQPLLRG